MAIDETGLAKGLVRKLNALRRSVGDDLAEEVFEKWLERRPAAQAKTDPVAAKIAEALAGIRRTTPSSSSEITGTRCAAPRVRARRASSCSRTKRQSRRFAGFGMSTGAEF